MVLFQDKKVELILLTCVFNLFHLPGDVRILLSFGRLLFLILSKSSVIFFFNILRGGGGGGGGLVASLVVTGD